MVEVNRVIVNRGVLEIPLDLRECESFSLYCQIERKDLNASINVKRPRGASFYGYAQGMEGGYVLWEKPLTFENEELYFWQNPYIVGLTSQDCQTKTILDTIDNLAIALGLTPLGPYTGEVVAERLPIDSVVFKLFGKTTLYLRAIFRPSPLACSVAITWKDRDKPVEPLSGGRTPFPPPPVPVNLVDPDGYDLGDPPYDGVDDDGDTYSPPRPNCTGCSLTITHDRPGEPRFPGGPPAVSPNAVVNFTAEQCPVRVESDSEQGGSPYEVDANYRVYDRNNTLLFGFTSYTFNAITVDVDNGECF